MSQPDYTYTAPRRLVRRRDNRMLGGVWAKAEPPRIITLNTAATENLVI